MAKAAPKLEWCVVRLGEDMNWWVQEISDEVHWDVDGLSILDPRQISHIMDQIDLLREYDFQDEIFEAAFYKFKIEKKLDNDCLRLVRTNASILEGEEVVFALPDIIDEEKGPYADLVDHVSRLRVKMLNDSFEFEQKLTLEELEDEIREEQNNDFLEGRAIHVFTDINAILEYVPAGYELDDEDDAKEEDAEIEEDFPDIDDEEKIEEDETMKWDGEDDEEEEEEKDEDESENLDDLEDDEEEEPRASRKR